MSEINQAKFELHKGVILTITPLSAFAQKAFHARAAQMFPEPDRAPFEVEIEDAFKPGTKTKAEDSTEWLALMRDVLQLRSQAYIGLLLDATCNVEDRAALLEPYTHAVEAFKVAVKDLPVGAALSSNFVALLLGVLAEEQEVSALIRLAQGATPLTDAEIVDGYRYFRPVVVSRPGRANRTHKPQSQDIPASEQPAARPDDDGVRSGGYVRADTRSIHSSGIGPELVRFAAADEGGAIGLREAGAVGVGIGSE